MRIVIVTGLSGAGKSTALRALEDYGYYCVDNLPLPMSEQLVTQLAADGIGELALAVDARQAQHIAHLSAHVQALGALHHDVDVLYLEASDHALQNRYNATRRRHPLSTDDISAGIASDRDALTRVLDIPGVNIIDTSELNVHELKARIQDKYGAGHGALSVVLMSFGFKYGPPSEANLLFDVRFLGNPFFKDELRALDGRDPGVSEYVMQQAEARQMAEHIEGILRFTLPRFQEERKLYLTVAIGCTGGRHRSVALVEHLYQRIHGDWDIVKKHRDLDSRT